MKILQELQFVLKAVSELSKKQMEDFLNRGAKFFVSYYDNMKDFKIKSSKLPNSKKEASVPRLEIIKTNMEGSFGPIFLRGIVRYNVLGELVLTPFDFSSTTGNDIPRRLLADALNELFELKIPLFYRENNKISYEITLESHNDHIPNGLRKKMIIRDKRSDHLERLNKISAFVTKEESEELLKEAIAKYGVSGYKELMDKFFNGEIDIDPIVVSKIAVHHG